MLYVIDGPVVGSGYSWYRVWAPRTSLAGWVAAGSKAGEDWLAPVPLPCTLGASPDETVDKIGYDLMHLACYTGVEFEGAYRLAPYKHPRRVEVVDALPRTPATGQIQRTLIVERITSGAV